MRISSFILLLGASTIIDSTNAAFKVPKSLFKAIAKTKPRSPEIPHVPVVPHTAPVIPPNHPLIGKPVKNNWGDNRVSNLGLTAASPLIVAAPIIGTTLINQSPPAPPTTPPTTPSSTPQFPPASVDKTIDSKIPKSQSNVEEKRGAPIASKDTKNASSLKHKDEPVLLKDVKGAVLKPGTKKEENIVACTWKPGQKHKRGEVPEGCEDVLTPGADPKNLVAGIGANTAEEPLSKVATAPNGVVPPVDAKDTKILKSSSPRRNGTRRAKGKKKNRHTEQPSHTIEHGTERGLHTADAHSTQFERGLHTSDGDSTHTKKSHHTTDGHAERSQPTEDSNEEPQHGIAGMDGDRDMMDGDMGEEPDSSRHAGKNRVQRGIAGMGGDRDMMDGDMGMGGDGMGGAVPSWKTKIMSGCSNPMAVFNCLMSKGTAGCRKGDPSCVKTVGVGSVGCVQEHCLGMAPAIMNDFNQDMANGGMDGGMGGGGMDGGMGGDMGGGGGMDGGVGGGGMDGGAAGEMGDGSSASDPSEAPGDGAAVPEGASPVEGAAPVEDAAPVDADAASDPSAASVDDAAPIEGDVSVNGTLSEDGTSNSTLSEDGTSNSTLSEDGTSNSTTIEGADGVGNTTTVSIEGDLPIAGTTVTIVLAEETH